MVTVQTCGGLANRMRAMSSGVSLANDIGMPVTIVWAENWELGAQFEQLFEPVEKVKIVHPSRLKLHALYECPRKKIYLSLPCPKSSFGARF